ncbi:hypothetical protein GWI33_004634 [Rhynchophorus ferrugineus]|uniref:Uncharacterized protein n=1 Tax=Rhynchophorus ferrugineus TaxID=354439 RepID=A0A834IUF3_RHYFE|nr:hypothetical protein GWI33_004634 [Rhynchophorus ferrugineus]
MDKKEFRVLIKYCFLKGKNTVEAKPWLGTEFPDTAPGKSTTKDWTYCLRCKFTDWPVASCPEEEKKSHNICRFYQLMNESKV